MKFISLFAGIGGFDLGFERAETSPNDGVENCGGRMKTTRHVSITGEIYGHPIVTGRPASLDPKVQFSMRLHQSTLARIAAVTGQTRKFIEDAVYDKLSVSQLPLNP